MSAPPSRRSASAHGSPEDSLRHAITHASHLLPAQGPIAVFIHHNTLHAFEHLPFQEAVLQGERTFGGRPYLSEAEYRAHHARGRITDADLQLAQARVADRSLDAGATIGGGITTRGALRGLLLRHAIEAPDAASVSFLLHDAGGIDHVRDDAPESARARIRGSGRSEREALSALFRACEALLADAPPWSDPRAPYVRHRDALLDGAGIDIDAWIHPVLIRTCAAFLDGMTAYWQMPERQRGVYVATRALEIASGALRPAWMRGAIEAFRSHAAADASAERACLEALEALGVSPAVFEPFLAEILRALPGWAGMFHTLETKPDPHHHGGPPRLIDFLALRLTLESSAVQHAMREAGIPGPPGALFRRTRAQEPTGRTSDAHVLFQIFQILGVPATRAAGLGQPAAREILAEVRAFDERARRRIWHEAYELHYAREIGGAIAAHTPCPTFEPKAQVMACIDEREEAFRRHIEEVDPAIETFGVAGFFGLPIAFQGIDDAHATARCPVVVVPDRHILERPVGDDHDLLEKRSRRRRTFALVQDALGVSSRMFVRGAILHALIGWLAAIPMAARVLAPRLVAKLSARWAEALFPAPRTRLIADATQAEEDAAVGKIGGHAHDEQSDRALGLPLAEQIDRVQGVLDGMGTAGALAPLVIVLGHGSNSLNNPHESAHDCGACGGRHGGPNARLFAHIANDPRVREGLRARGLVIPESTWFVGGEHDTCTDAVFFWDIEEIPETHRALFREMESVLEQARARSAHERCRRFDFAPHGLSPEGALAEVERRALAYDEPRPEYGHATNAFCVVGRRSRTRGLFLDRRGFLVSYDPTKDADGAILVKTLSAVGPVCGGISLEYYFSYVDNEVYGCGTKLPHNVTAGLGVMNGAGSDLRTGLPWQMVEVHEPMRLLLIVEREPEDLAAVIARVPSVKNMLEKSWIRVAALRPGSGEVIEIHADGSLAPPITAPPTPIASVRWSAEHYGGHRQHLPPARLSRPVEIGARSRSLSGEIAA